jgi:hypothetical protein
MYVCFMVCTCITALQTVALQTDSNMVMYYNTDMVLPDADIDISLTDKHIDIIGHKHRDRHRHRHVILRYCIQT